MPSTIKQMNSIAKNKKTMEFHISRKSRDQYQFSESLFQLNGNVIFVNFYAVRVFAQKLNDKRDLIHFPEQTIRAGHLNAMGLIDEILHYIMELYREQKKSSVVKEIYEWLEDKFGAEAVDKTIRQFADEFPSLAVYRREIDLENYLKGGTEGIPNKQIVLEEMLMLWLENLNPAFSPFNELFDDTSLAKMTAYKPIMESFQVFFDTQPRFGPGNQNLIEMLRSPAIAVPNSLFGQLEYIREKWGYLLGKYLYRLLSGLDLIREEEKLRSLGVGPMSPLEFAGTDYEYERYSLDRDWMPRVVLIAKTIYVWLDQLSKKYQRSIKRLDQIPDEELDTLARWGFTGLWLIGLWERSKASQTIKRNCGNPEAEASAYALYDYQIANDLGGDHAFQSLKTRCWQRGIRMAGDMVPNHVGIDGRWVIEHPDWFISLDYSPYPAYSFSGLDLSWDQRVGIFIEDHYYSRNDAAVVFKRVDYWTGSEKYIYHGNDGTSMPWNDTAQLDYLNPEVREAVIQTILHVARNFPIIRFDAAMTLTKRHFQRLWFPQLGTGGDIPSRAEHGITKQEFDKAMPQEFWREVVDRLAQEASDTLLLAEAFWLMEGYFVRTLGMHRVYNSSFMNMLKTEDNAKYRSTIKNVLEFDPEILKRFVNFMNNPDEDTAIAQFGKADKYMGVCIMMVTMPGLPMFGHGQIEGFTEKYGMEYRRAYWDEQPDEYLIQRHEREVFPLIRRRYLFAHVHNFLLYDFYTTAGYVNEDVFAYSNSAGNDRALVVYHNKYSHVAGWVRTSAAYLEKKSENDRNLVQKNLGEGLHLQNRDDYFCIFRDHITGLEYIRNSKELFENGLYVELGAYKYHVFLDFREVQDNIWHHYANLTAYLNGRGVPNVDEALKETFLRPIHFPFKEIINADTLKQFAESQTKKYDAHRNKQILNQIEQNVIHLLREIKTFTSAIRDEEILAKEMSRELETIMKIPQLKISIKTNEPKYQSAIKYLIRNLSGFVNLWPCLLGWWSVHNLGKIISEEGFEDQSRSWIDEWLFGKVIAATLQDIEINESDAWQIIRIIKLLTSHQSWFEIENLKNEEKVYHIIESLLKDEEIRQFLQVNRYQEILWFNKEAFEQLLGWLFLEAVIMIKTKYPRSQKNKITAIFEIIRQLDKIKKESGYQVEKLLRIKVLKQ